MGQYLLGLDAGNTVVKAVLFDASGVELAVAALGGNSIYPQPGFVERDMHEQWTQASHVIRSVIAKAAIDPSDIICVGCAGHGNGLYVLDKSDEPLLAIQPLDSRAMDLVSELHAQGIAETVYPLCLQKPWPSQTATLLAWLKRHRPGLYARIGTTFLCKDFVVFKLTDVRGSDMSDMSAAGLLNMRNRRYDQDLMAAYDLADAFGTLPELHEAYEVVGAVSRRAAAETGLYAGTPVVAGLFDVIASALGSGVGSVGQASIVAGTWSINQIIAEVPLVDDRIFLWSDFGPGLCMANESSATSAANLEWFVKEFIAPGMDHDDDVSSFDVCNDMVAKVSLDGALPIFHPYLYGTGKNSAARAGFYGIGGWHGRAQLLHALYEGVVFGHRAHVETLRAAGCAFESVVLSGGGSRSPVWPQMFADILNMPIAISACQETGALGAAIAAGIGGGVFSSYADGVAKMTSLDRRYAPDKARQAVYDQRFNLFSELGQTMAGPWEHLKLIQ